MPPQSAHSPLSTDSIPAFQTKAWTGLRWLLVGIAGIWLSYQFWRLLFQETPSGNVALAGAVGAVDLALRHLEVTGWFEGKDIYRYQGNAVYPPASYLMLYPFVGWLKLSAARILWAVFTSALIIRCVNLFERAHGENSPAQRRLLMLIPLATYPLGATVGNGQLGILVLTCLLTCLPRIEQRPSSWCRDLGIAGLFLIALIKPTLAAPFFWILLFMRGGLRPAVLTCFGYVGLTALASLPQEHGPLRLMKIWYGRGVHGSAWGAEHGEGSIRVVTNVVKSASDAIAENATEAIQTLRITSINLHSMMGYLGHADKIALATLIVLILTGIWVWWYRRCSVWMLMGVVGIITRFYTYHGWYDDLVLLLPMIALVKIARDSAKQRNGGSRMAGFLFVAMLMSLLAPGGGYLFPYPWNNVYLITQSVLWIGVLIFLATRMRAPELSPAEIEPVL